MRSRGKKLTKDDVPEHFDERSIATLNRIRENHTVLGYLFIRNGIIELNSTPETMAQTISTKLPAFNVSVMQAVNEITASFNEVNPMVDRIMNDESVGGVIMTNKEGAPILTNTNLMAATHYGSALQRLGAITQTYIKDINPFDEVLVLRVNTKKQEMMIAPHADFTIIVLQQSCHKSVHKNK